MNNPLLLSIVKDDTEIVKTVLTNITKMLVNRKWLSNEKETINKLHGSINEDQLYKIPLNVNLFNLKTYDPIENDNNRNVSTDFNDKIVMVKIVHVKVTSIAKFQAVFDFLNDYKNYHKILVVSAYSEKAKQMISKFGYTEIFTERFLMVNLPDVSCSPQYEILSLDEIEQLSKEYSSKKNQFKKIFDSDAASQYLYLKRGQIVRITRYSEITGYSIDYRIVVKGNIM